MNRFIVINIWNYIIYGARVRGKGCGRVFGWVSGSLAGMVLAWKKSLTFKVGGSVLRVTYV